MRSEITFKVLLFGLLMLTVSCMPKVEEEETVPVVKLTSSAVNGTTNTAMKITLLGTCPSSTYLMRVLVNNQESRIGQANTAAVANSGIPVGSCTKGTLTIVYPVPNPTLARSITFKVKAQLTDGRSSVEWAVRTVSYIPPSPGVPGFAVVAVGGVSTGAGLTMHGSGGELAGGVGNQAGAPANVLTSTQTMLRSGLHGVLLE
jgi:hypothetical protein